MKTNFKKLPNSTRKFIRSEKASIRRQFLDYKAQEEAIANMYNKILNQPLGHNPFERSPTGEAIVKDTEVEEPVKLEKISPKKPSAIIKKVKQEKKNTKKYKKKKIKK